MTRSFVRVVVLNITRSFVRVNVFNQIYEVFIMFNFANHLQSLRKAHNVTQKEVAIAIGISERGYQQYEYGERKPNYDYLIALADYFDVSLDYLVGRSDDPRRR